MPTSSRVRRGNAALAAAGAGLLVSSLALLASPAHAADPVEVNILGINDFHGRINANGSEAGAAVLAGAVDQIRSQHPNTVFAAAGDLIGASTFESFIAHDKPTIDALNAAGLEVSAVGNHEFDQGYDDLLHRVMAPYDPATNPYGGAEWEYIGANVHHSDPASDLLEPSWVRDFGAVQVGFVGAVTEHLDELVSPSGIEGVQVEDVVTATNREAAALKASGADLVVLLVHEGAPGTDCAAMDDDPSSDFGSIVTGVDANVDAIVSGHTHLSYDCKFPVAEWAGRAVTERPVVSAGQYGYNLNQLTFSVDPATGDVVGLDTAILDLTTTPAYPSDPEVAQIVADANAAAQELGARPLGQIAKPFNRAKLSTGAENRGGESTLGNLVAEVQRWATSDPAFGAAQIAFMNPGGLRADLTGLNAEGYPATVTYKQAAVVQPFANTLVNMRMTGAQIRKVLEEQWQPAGSSRPFLKLGTSSGFEYTYDPTAGPGEHVQQIWLQGEELEPARTYSVTANSFLAAGGDNFSAFTGATGKRDTGQIDLQAMVDYMAEFADVTPLAPDYSQHAVGVSYPEGRTGFSGGVLTVDLSSLAFSTPADLKDTSVRVTAGRTDLGSFPVDNTVGTAVFDEAGTATADVQLRKVLGIGWQELTVTGNRTGTSVEMPVQVMRSSS